jgi:hypothetical protein
LNKEPSIQKPQHFCISLAVFKTDDLGYGRLRFAEPAMSSSTPLSIALPAEREILELVKAAVRKRRKATAATVLEPKFLGEADIYHRMRI